MDIFIEQLTPRSVVLISTDERLDLSACEAFNQAASIACSNPFATAIVVDLAKTRQLFDSGKAILLNLRQIAGHLKSRIFLSNVGPEIAHQLQQGSFPELFYISLKPISKVEAAATPMLAKAG
ncbi:MAG: hypothetical protein H8E21_03140 [Gammaproteobacteria bacterium]|nr:hypothetical protein [Gammaproteobacteria bacterium]